MAGKKEEKEEILENNLKVPDIAPLFTEEISSEITKVIRILDSLSDDYYKTTDPHELESIKRFFNGHLQRFETLFSYVKVYKGPQNTFLEEERKKLKAETVMLLVSRKMNKTEAEKFAYVDPYYIERLAMIRKIMRVFIKIESLYKRYNQTAQFIMQSISYEGKIMEKDFKMG